MKLIDFHSFIPYYHQLYIILKESIDEKELKPGDMLPSENELCETYGISRTVVRAALQNLESEGEFRTERGGYWKGKVWRFRMYGQIIRAWWLATRERYPKARAFFSNIDKS